MCLVRSFSLVISTFVTSLTALQAGSISAVNSTSCQKCHEAESRLWLSSHHSLAERPLQSEVDRASFDPIHIFVAGSKTNQARVLGGECQLLTADLATNIQPHRVERVIGCDPLRQFLTATTNGRSQAQEVAFDMKSNQWFDIYGDENRQPGEWGHWTGRGMNWNSMCAECHNTRLEKNYNEVTDSYGTTMAEMGVGCESCHGSLTAHIGWQKAHPNSKVKDPTIPIQTARQVLATCGSCHSRRDNLTGQFMAGEAFSDHYSLEILDETDQWYADGQVRGEDYEFVSFTSSKMHQSGVTCLDCHDAHSGKTRLPGNDLCMRCHVGAFPKAPIIKPDEHGHHKFGQGGDSCIGCHMPVTVYMQRHPRHDHGFTIPGC